MGFPRQEYWIPLPSPGFLPDPDQMHVSCVSCIGRWILYHWITWEYSECVCCAMCWVTQLCPTLIPWSAARQAPLFTGILQKRILEWVAMPSSRRSSQPGIKPRSPALQADSLPVGPRGKPKNAGVGSLPLLQGTLLIEESNQGLLHCRQILYQLNFQGSPIQWILSN